MKAKSGDFLLALCLWLSTTVLCKIAHADDFLDELPRIPVVEASDTLKNFHVADGFKVELVASEPLVNSPVAIEWDARGRMFVCEMRGYSEDRDDGVSRVSLLTDKDGDGVYDSSTIYADHLLWPTALFPYKDGLFVADAPNIYYLRDTNDDGVADEKEIVITGFKVSNVQGLLNSFRWGLDNRIHVACGTVGGKVRRSVDPESKAVEVRGHDLAFDPNTYEFELTSGGAQHGMCFDDWGRKYVSSNSVHLQQVMYEDRYITRNQFLSPPPSRVSISADGPQAEVYRVSPVEPWRIVRTRLRVAGVVRGPVEGGGRAAGYFTGATGVTIFRGDQWPDDMKGLAIVGDVGSNLVHRKRLNGDNIQRVGTRMDKESEFVASRDIWFRPAQFACGPDGTLSIIDVCREVIEHPASLPPDIKKHLDLTAGRDRGRIYRVVPKRFHQRPYKDLSDMDTPQLVQLLDHPNAWHRETASRLIFERQDKSTINNLQNLATKSESAHGRMHSLYALDGLAALDESTIIERLGDTHPEVVRHAIRLCESLPISKRLVIALRPLVTHSEVDVRYQLAFSIGQWKFGERNSWLAKILAQSPNDRWIQTAVASSLSDGAGPLFVSLVRSTKDASPEFLEKLANQINRQKNDGEYELALASLMDASPSLSLLPVLGQLSRGKPQTDELAARRSELLTLAASTATDESKSDSQRRQAITALLYGDSSIAVPPLQSILKDSTSSDLQLVAIGTLRRFLNASVVDSMLESWPTLSPRLRNAALDALLSKAVGRVGVLNAIEDGTVNADEIQISRWKTLANDRDKTVRESAESYLASAANRSRESVIESYRNVLKLTGDPTRGAVIFKQHCAGCHRVGDVGHEIGPSLAAAKTRGAESILVNVLDPNREANPQYLNYVVLTDDGGTHTGMITSENANSITLKRAEAVTQTILRSDIEQIRGTGQSIMPEGLEKNIKPNDMADLLEFLMQ